MSIPGGPTADDVPVRSVTVRAPAKVNLHLGVGALRGDGYHDVTTVYQALSLYDEVRVAPGRLAVSVTGEGGADVPTGEDNLAVRAVRALARHLDRPAEVELDITKGIPVSAGLAGGSADAAAALLACTALWGCEVDRRTLQAIAARIGSDVPFALHGGTALGVGRGEQLTPVLGHGDYHWVLAFADEGLATPRVYAELDRLRGAARPNPAAPLASRPEAVLTALRAGDPVRLGRALGNDLQPAAVRLRPRLRQVLEAGLDAGALGGIVSGSGPTCAFLARSETHAVALAASLAGAGVCRTVRRAHAPAPGARVVAGSG